VSNTDLTKKVWRAHECARRRRERQGTQCTPRTTRLSERPLGEKRRPKKGQRHPAKSTPPPLGRGADPALTGSSVRPESRRKTHQRAAERFAGWLRTKPTEVPLYIPWGGFSQEECHWGSLSSEGTRQCQPST
jgi:hypothetical protein